MKKSIFTKAFLVAGCIAAFSACDENAWNDKLDGFEEANDANTPKDVVAIEYTLTDKDYGTIANNSTNKAIAKEAGVASELAALANSHYFTEVIKPDIYVPAFFSDPSFPYFASSDGSAIKLTYNMGTGIPEAVTLAPSASQYLLTEDDYKAAWGDDEKYISAFAPSVPASRNLGKILLNAYPEAVEGQYAIVTYSVSDQEPVFGNPDPGESFELSSTIANAVPKEPIEVNGIVTGVATNGYILTDASGSIFVYVKNDFDPAKHAIGTQISLSGNADSYNFGLQIDGASMEEKIVGTQEYTFPSPVVYTGSALDSEVATRIEDGSNFLASYVEVTGTVSINGNNINILLPGGEKAQASAYYATDAMKALLVDGSEVTLKGWWIAIAAKKYCSIVATSVSSAATTSVASRAAIVEVPTYQQYAIYRFNGTSWSVPAGFAVVQPSDYTAMGQTYGNLTEPDLYLPGFLRTTFPYAQPDDVKYVLYKLYKDGKTKYACDYYKYDGSAWAPYNGVVVQTAQYVRNGGKWLYDPNVTITLPAGKGQELSSTYYQACVDWVFENICKPLGDDNIKSGKFYVTSYGNNEYYSGTSAYQNNVDLRAGSARAQYEAGWAGYSDEEIVATMKERFTHEVLPAALSTLNSDAKPIDGLDVIYTVNFSAYDGTNTLPYVVRYKVVAPAKFEFIDCTWD